MQYVVVFLEALLVSHIATRILAVHYIRIIDKYMEGWLDGTKSALKDVMRR